VKGNPAFLADVPACLARAGAILSADPDLNELAGLLAGFEGALGADRVTPA